MMWKYSRKIEKKQIVFHQTKEYWIDLKFAKASWENIDIIFYLSLLSISSACHGTWNIVDAQTILFLKWLNESISTERVWVLRCSKFIFLTKLRRVILRFAIIFFCCLSDLLLILSNVFSSLEVQFRSFKLSAMSSVSLLNILILSSIFFECMECINNSCFNILVSSFYYLYYFWVCSFDYIFSLLWFTVSNFILHAW